MRGVLFASLALTMVSATASAEVGPERFDLVCSGTMYQYTAGRKVGETRWKGRIKVDGPAERGCIDTGGVCKIRKVYFISDEVGYLFDVDDMSVGGAKRNNSSYAPAIGFNLHIYYKEQGAIPADDFVYAPDCRREPFSGLPAR